MSELLLVVWLALLGASRIDLLGETGPLLLTPFLVLTPLLIAWEFWRVARGGWRLRIPPHAWRYLTAVSALMALLLASTYLSFEPATAARRFGLLFVQVYLVFLMGIAIANRPAPGDLLLRGAYAGLGLHLLFNAAQLVTWFADNLWPEMPGRFVDLEPGNYFGVIPRLTGVSHDPNHGGLFALFYLALILVFAQPSRARKVMVTLGVIAILLTLSRAAGLAALTLWGVSALRHPDFRVSVTATGAMTAVLALLTAFFLLIPGALDPLLELGGMLGTRFTPDEGSSSQHVVLLARGWEVGTESLKNVFLGVGYGNAYVTVQDIFPGNEYGNFHSLFVTLFAEAGALSALLALGIFVLVFLRAGPYRPLVAGLFVFNLFQQAHTEPLMWLALMLGWLGVGLYSPEDRESTEPAPSGGFAARSMSPTQAEPGGQR